MPIKNDKYTPPHKSHDAMMKEWMRDPVFKAEYDSLEKEYELLKEMLRARKRAGCNQLRERVRRRVSERKLPDRGASRQIAESELHKPGSSGTASVVSKYQVCSDSLEGGAQCAGTGNRRAADAEQSGR